MEASLCQMQQSIEKTKNSYDLQCLASAHGSKYKFGVMSELYKGM